MEQIEFRPAWNLFQRPFDGAGRVAHRGDGECVFQIVVWAHFRDLAPHQTIAAFGAEHGIGFALGQWLFWFVEPVNF